MGAAFGCAGGLSIEDPEVDEFLAPYLDTWVVKVRGGRDRAIIGKDKIIFYTDGDTSITGTFHTDLGGPHGRQVGEVYGNQAGKPLSFGKSPTGEIYWDGYGSFCSVPIHNGNPDCPDVTDCVTRGLLRAAISVYFSIV